MSDTTINLRAHRASVALIDRAAEIEGKTRSAFLRDCATAAAHKVFPVLVGERCPLCGAIESTEARTAISSAKRGE